MLIGWKWPVQIVLIHFGTQVLLRSIALRSLTVEGFVPTLELVILSSSYSEWMLLLIPPMWRCNNLCNSILFVLWYYRCMDVIFDWDLGIMTYNSHDTLRLCGFPFAEIGVVSFRIYCHRKYCCQHSLLQRFSFDSIRQYCNTIN